MLYIVLIIYDLIKCGMLVKEKHNLYICILRSYCAYSNKIDLSIQLRCLLRLKNFNKYHNIIE